MSDAKVDLTSAKTAFTSFFAEDDKDKKTEGENPVDKVLNQVKEGKVSPDKKRDITKVNTNNPGKQTTISVEEAKGIIDREKTYEEIMKDLKIKHSEIFPIIDMYLEKGYYEKKYVIRAFEFGFRSKQVYSIDNISGIMDGTDYVTPGAITQLGMKHRLASTLVYFKLGKNTQRIFEHNSVEDDEKVHEFITKSREVSAPIYSVLVRYLNKFDLLVGLATREEAIERFLAHTTDSEGLCK